MTGDSSTPRGRPGRWTQRAGFSVLFDVTVGPTADEIWRTRIYHDESGQEIELAGSADERWPRWILDRLAASGRERGPSTVVHELTVEIVDARILSHTSGPDDVERVRVEADLHIGGLAALEQRLGAAVLERTLADRPPRRS